MPSLTCPERTSRTVILITSPMRMFSPNFRVRTNMDDLPGRGTGPQAPPFAHKIGTLRGRLEAVLDSRARGLHGACRAPARASREPEGSMSRFRRWLVWGYAVLAGALVGLGAAGLPERGSFGLRL